MVGGVVDGMVVGTLAGLGGTVVMEVGMVMVDGTKNGNL